LWNLAIVKGVIGGLLSFLVITAISGLIQDAFPRWVKEVLIPWLSRYTIVPNWLLVVAPTASVVAIIVAARLSKTEVWLDPADLRNLRYAADYMHYKGFFGLTNSIDSELRQSLEKQGDSNSLHKFVESVFTKTFEFFGPEVRTGVVFRPKEDTPEWLGAWQASPGHYLTEKTFYVGQEPGNFGNRGAAGKVFVENVPVKYNIIDQKTGKADQPCKKVFPEYEEKRRGTDYLSSAVLPVRWNKRVVGVFCIDSKRKDFFGDEDMAMMQVVADRIGDALYLHKALVS
jgi:hypothetical protein